MKVLNYNMQKLLAPVLFLEDSPNEKLCKLDEI